MSDLVKQVESLEKSRDEFYEALCRKREEAKRLLAAKRGLAQDYWVLNENYKKVCRDLEDLRKVHETLKADHEALLEACKVIDDNARNFSRETLSVETQALGMICENPEGNSEARVSIPLEDLKVIHEDIETLIYQVCSLAQALKRTEGSPPGDASGAPATPSP
jgi:chromosome segregation ATPase